MADDLVLPRALVLRELSCGRDHANEFTSLYETLAVHCMKRSAGIISLLSRAVHGNAHTGYLRAITQAIRLESANVPPNKGLS